MTDDEHRADDLTDYKVVRPGDIVINRMRAFQGAVGQAPVDGLVSPDYLVLRLDASLSGRYFHHLFRSHWFVSEMASRLRGIGSIGQGNVRTPRINVEDLGDICIDLPCSTSQRRIAAFLDVETERIDELVAAKTRMIDLLAERTRSDIACSILGSIDPTDYARRGAGIRTFPLSQVVRLQRGHDLPADLRTPGDVPVVTSGGVSGSHDTPIAAGPGVITGRYGTVGSVYYVDEPYWPHNTTLYVEDFRGNHPRWVYYLLQCLPFDAEAEKTAVGGINRNVVGRLRVPVPEVGEQMRVASDLDERIESRSQLSSGLKQQIDLLQERRRSLITSSVTGEMEVP